MNRLALPIICLFVGGTAGALVGYRWGVGHGQGVVAVSRAVSAQTSSSLGQMPGASSAHPSEGTTSSRRGGSHSLPAAIDAMLSRFDALEAERWALNPDLSLEEILASLSYLSGKPKDTKNKPELKALLYRAWAKKEQDKAWAAALVDGDGPRAGYYLGAVARQVATAQPVAAIGLGLSLGIGEQRRTVLRDVFEEWGKGDLVGAVAYLNAHPELPAGAEGIVSAIKIAAETNPAFAASLAISLRNSNERGGVVADVLIGWANKDVVAALKWAQGITDPEQMRLQTMIVVDAWAGKDPLAALAFAEKINDAGARSGAVRNAWNNWLRQSPDAAMDYLAKHPTVALLAAAEWGFISDTKFLTLEEQQALLLKVPGEELKQKLGSSLVDTQTSKGQYLPALQLINAMPDSRNRDNAITKLGVVWGRDDPQAVASWLKTQPDSSDRDLAIEGFTRSLAVTDPKAAIDWINSVPDKGIREGGLKNIATKWLDSDPAAAGAWLSTQTWISEAERAEMVKRASKGDPNSWYTYGINVTNRR